MNPVHQSGPQAAGRIRFPVNFAALKNSDFVKNVLVVMSGTTLAQALGFALSPIISRIYSPTDFGVFGSFTAILSVIVVGMTLEYSQALILPKQQDHGFGLFVISCLLTFLTAGLCLVACLVAPGFLLNSMKATNAWILVLLVSGVLVSGLNRTLQSWCVRVKAFRQTSASQVVRSLSANGSQIGLGFLKSGSTALVFAVVLGDFLATLCLVKVMLREFKALWHGINWKGLWPLAKEYRDFPLYSASTNVINSLSLGLPIFLLTRYYGIAVAGAYAFGVRLIQAPMALITTALRQVLFQKGAQAFNEKGRLVPLYLKITLGLFGIGLLPSLILLVWAPQIFSWVFGAQWRTAGVFAQSLVIWLLFSFCNVPAAIFVRIIRLQRRMFVYDQALLIARALVLILGGIYLRAAQTVFLFSLVGALMNVIFIVMIGRALMRMEGGTDLKSAFEAVTKG